MSDISDQSDILFAKALQELGLWEKPGESNAAASANALERYLEMHQLLYKPVAAGRRERKSRRREYLVLLGDFENRISQIRLVRRSEMARSQAWNFADYLRGACVLVECRLSLRLAYLAHLLHISHAPRIAEKAALKMFGSLFFGSIALSSLS